MKPKYYTIKIKVVETYSATALVKANNAKEAKAIAEKEYEESDYLYDKVTYNRDDVKTSFGKAKQLRRNQTETSLHAYIQTDSCEQ